MNQRPAWESYLEEHHDRHLEELFELLRIPSISALPDHEDDVHRAAEWVADALRAVGVPTVEIMATNGNPVVYGEWIVDPAKPTALIYGHYDVQPADPLDLWETPPFEPTIRDGMIYARGASDDKGNLFVPIKALEALVQTQGAPPINMKFTIEGEEEVGSPNLPVFIREQKELLACDVVLCADGGQWGTDTPSIATASKGICACQVNIRTTNTDLHSGQFGASVPNAVQAAVQLAATLHTPDGRVAIAGFYDTVRDLTEQEKREIRRGAVLRGGVHAGSRRQRTLGRTGLHTGRARLGTANLRHQRLLGRLPGRGHQDGHPVRGALQNHLPSRRQPGTVRDSQTDRGAHREALPSRRDGDCRSVPRRGPPVLDPPRPPDARSPPKKRSPTSTTATPTSSASAERCRSPRRIRRNSVPTWSSTRGECPAARSTPRTRTSASRKAS